MSDREHYYDVLIVGAGNAALCAAHSAADHGAKRIGILEKAPKEERGGNSTLTGSLRFAYNSVDELIAIMRPEDDNPKTRRELQENRPHLTREELWDEVTLVTEGLSDPELLRVHVDESYETIRWLHSKGHNWVPEYSDRTAGNIVQCEGMGMGLQMRHFEYLERSQDATFHYETAGTELITDGQGGVTGVRALSPNGVEVFHAGSTVLACGGFEGNAEMRARYLGPRWDYVHNRGVPYNTGDGLNMALAIGALPYGGWGSCHATPNDWALPDYVLPSMRRAAPRTKINRYVYPYSIMVNTDGKRFVDEADNIRGMTYAKMGRSVLAQPGGKAFQLIDAKVRRLGLVPSSYDHATGEKAGTIRELAEKLGLPGELTEETVSTFNRAVPTDVEARPDPYRMDGVHTIGLDPPKSNYAMTIDEPPFEGYVVRCGITFTFGGLRIDPVTSQVQHTAGRAIPGLYAAGEMVGGLWYWNYPSGSGMMAGATFGRHAGHYATLHAAQRLRT